MYTLYYIPGSCSMAIHVILNELNAPLTLEQAGESGKQARPTEFLTLNPRGTVPALVDNGQLIREGAAIMMYLMDKHQSALLPREGLARATALEWLMFCNATLHPAYGRAFAAMRMFGNHAINEETKNTLLKLAVEQINKYWQEIEERLSKQSYLCGENITAADILLTVIANWSPRVSPDITFGSKTKAFFKTVISRPSYQKALAAEHVEYKVAA